MTLRRIEGGRPRLVATDLDGTLVRHDRTISPRSADVLARLSAEDIRIVIVTGRPLRWLIPVYEQLAITPLAVCANGAVVYDPVEDAIVHSASLSPEVLAEVADRLRAAVPGVVFAVERDGGRTMRHEPGYPVGGWETGMVSVTPAEPAELFAEPAVKLLVNAGPQPADEFTALVADRVTGLAEATNSSSSGTVEVSAAGVTKASGLAVVSSWHGVDAADIVAFGDMPNDLPMLDWAGLGVAMANAHPAVLATATHVTVSNDEDGVAAFLEDLFADVLANAVAPSATD